MGPHSFKCGKARPTSANRRAVSYFNGAALFQVRKALCFSPHLKHEMVKLQWGRTLSSAERTGFAPAAKIMWKNFNGAALFQVRKAPSTVKTATLIDELQWGRTLSSAESEQK